MATVKRNYSTKNNELISIRIKVYKGVDTNGNELPAHTTTIKIPKGLTKRQIESFIKEQEVLFESKCKGGLSSKSNIRFRDFAPEVMEIKKLSGKAVSTLSRYQDMLNDRILPFLGHMKIKDITGSLLNEFYKSLTVPGANKRHSNNGLSNKTILEYHRLLSTIFEEARKQRIIEFNPAKDASPPSVTKKEVNYFQPHEVRMIMDAFNKETIKWRTLGFLMLTYGGRRGEFIGLKRSSINFENHTITISSCVLYRHNVGIYDTPFPKNKKPRVMPMSKEIETLLIEYLNWLDNEKIKLADKWENTDYIFTSETGGLINPDTVSKHYERLSKKLQKENENFPSLNSHAFRHTVASTLLANGVDIVTVSDYIGDEPKTLMGHYAHIISDAKREAFDKMNDIIFK